MSEYEILLERLLQQKPDLTKSEVEEKINETKERIGAGYLTDQGALFLIASDLGISLSKVPKSEKRKKYTIEKTTPSAQDIEKKYHNISQTKKKSGILSAVASFLTVYVLFTGFYLVNLSEYNFDSIEIGVIASLVIALIMIIALLSKIRGMRIKKKELIFWYFGKTHESLQTFLDVQTKENNKNIQESFSDLANYIVDWTSITAPKALSKLPNSIVDNLKERIIPLIKARSINDLKQLKDLIYEFLVSIYENEPDTKNLTSLNYELESFPKITEVEERIESIFYKKPLLKPIIISIIFSMIFFGILILLQAPIWQAVGFSIASAIGIIAFLKREFQKR